MQVLVHHRCEDVFDVAHRFFTILWVKKDMSACWGFGHSPGHLVRAAGRFFFFFFGNFLGSEPDLDSCLTQASTLLVFLSCPSLPSTEIIFHYCM